MVTPKGSMSTEGETLQVSVLPYRRSVCPFCCVCLGCCAAEFGSSGGTYELPCTWPPEKPYHSADLQNNAGRFRKIYWTVRANLWPLRTELDLWQCSYLVHTAAKQAVSTKQFVSTLCWLQASRKQADGDALICKLWKVHRSVSVPDRDGKLFAIWLELRTNLGASVPLCPFHLQSQHSSPLSLYLFLALHFQALGDAGRCMNTCVHQKIISFCVFIPVNCLLKLSQRCITQHAQHSTPPQWLEATPTPCRGQFHVWSTIKRRQRLISGLRVQVRRGLGVGGNISRTRKGLNIVFHTWNLTSSVRDLVTPDIWRWPTDTHMFVCGTPSRLAGPNRKRRGVPSSLVSQISIN